MKPTYLAGRCSDACISINRYFYFHSSRVYPKAFYIFILGVT